jgi:hypothetical protein
MASSSQPFLNTKDSSLNVDTPVFTRYDSNMSVEMLLKENEVLKFLKMLFLGMFQKMMLKMLLVLMHTYQICI